MMARARVGLAVLALAATLSAFAPLSTLFAQATWLVTAAVLGAVVAALGCAARAFRLPAWGVLIAQAIGGILALSWTQLPATLWFGLPTLTTADEANRLLRQAVTIITSYAAPAPVTPGVGFALLAVFLGLGLSIDFLVATISRPVVAGFPLFIAFLLTAANTYGVLHWGWFVAPAVLWLSMLVLEGRTAARRWGVNVLRPSEPEPGPGRLLSFAAGSGLGPLGRALIGLSLATAIALGSFLPHLPARFLAEGLGRGPGAGAGGTGLATTIDVGRSLGDRSREPVLRYRAVGGEPPPLRVDVLEEYWAGQWRPTTHPQTPVLEDLDLPTPLAAAVPRQEAHIEVTQSTLPAPQLAAPAPARRVSAAGAPVLIDSSGVLRAGAKTTSYRVDYVAIRPGVRDFAGPPVAEVDFPGTLEVPDDVRAAVTPLMERLAGATQLATAQAIQDYLRGPEFTYSLELGAGASPGPEAPATEPIRTFLETKRGYCVQFASTMVMLARLQGIPARVAIGYLPGTLEGGDYVVRAADAHAWPELWFDNLGWVRFEPTPGVRTGVAPRYGAPVPAASASASSPGAASGRPRPSATRSIDLQREPGAAQESGLGQWLLDHLALLGTTALILLLTAAVPLGAAIERRRRRAAACTRAQQVEAEWTELLERLTDLGVSAPPGTTPRETGRALASRARLEESARGNLSALVDEVEHARYSGDATAGRSDGARWSRSIVEAVDSSRDWRTRLRARLLPSVGRDFWRRFGRS